MRISLQPEELLVEPIEWTSVGDLTHDWGSGRPRAISSFRQNYLKMRRQWCLCRLVHVPMRCLRLRGKDDQGLSQYLCRRRRQLRDRSPRQLLSSPRQIQPACLRVDSARQLESFADCLGCKQPQPRWFKLISLWYLIMKQGSYITDPIFRVDMTFPSLPPRTYLIL